MYGAGPVAQPELYDPADHVKLKVESGGLFEDLPRAADGTAIIGDPRNDENLMIAGLHCAFLLFHNRAVDYVRAQGRLTDPMDVFEEARRLTTWHYHWLTLHEFLPQFVGQAMVDDVLRRGRRFYEAERDEAFIPVEFQAGVYRMGHSMVRPSYRANLAGDNGKPFFGFVFDPSQEGKPDPDDLRGGSRAPRRFIGWQTFFDFGDGQVKPNKQIDTKISTAALQPAARRDRKPRRTNGAAAAEPPPAPDLAAPLRTERREKDRRHAARRPQTWRSSRRYGVGFEHSTPLWYYVLKEAEVVADGLHLGPVGGRIVAEVFVGLLADRPELVPRSPAPLATDTAEHGRLVPDD